MRIQACTLAILLSACPVTSEPEPEPDPAPLGMPLVEDGETYAGAAVVDVTPTVVETFDDLNGNALFDGCLDDPAGGTEACPEGFTDADGDDWFDAVFIGGFDPERPAQGVRDGEGIYVRAVVIAHDGEYVALVSLDLVGLAHSRIDEAGALLAADGFDVDKLLVTSTHNHQGPDTMGLWGDPLGGVPGFDETYQQTISQAIASAVRDAAAVMVPVDLAVGAQQMRDRSPYFNGAAFGGRNPTRKMHGMVRDIRDPVIVSDQLLAIQARDALGEVVFTLTSWSGHPEVLGGGNNLLNSDWVGVTRRVLQERYGGVALHVPESLGGMQSALGGDLPLVLEDGTHVVVVCTAETVGDAADPCFGLEVGSTLLDGDGLEVPVWAEHSSWDFVTSHGWHIAEAAIDILEGASVYEADPIRIDVERGYVPVRNIAYDLLGPQGIFDLGLDDAVRDPELCPAAPETQLGCLPFRVFRAQIGPVTLVTAPGELLPELSWGMPDDPQWALEAADPGERGPDSRYFPQHDPACDTIDPAACLDEAELDGCNCLKIHAWPYRISDDASHRPVLDGIDTEFKAAMSMTSTYLSYIVPEPSVNTTVSLFSDDVGDHYEDTVTPAFDFGTVYLETYGRIADRW